MKTVLIFGAAGFVGPYLSREFINAGYKVVGSDLNGRGSLPSEVDFKRADLLDPKQVDDVVKSTNPSVIVNLAAVSSVGLSWKIPQTTIQVNVIGSLNILESAKNLNPMPKILFVGSSEEYDISNKPIDENTPLNANNPYGISKVTQERFANMYKAQYGMQIYCVRPFNHTGVGQKDTFVLASFCKQAAEIEKSGKPGVIKVGNLGARRDFGHVKDLMRAYRMIVESDDCNVIYNVGTGKAHSLQKMLEYIISLSSQPITIEVDPERFRPIDNPYICCNNTKIKHELGWTPEFTVFDALKEMFNEFLKEA